MLVNTQISYLCQFYMLKIPDDLYPKAHPDNRKKVVYWRIKDCKNGFSDYFKDESDVTSYISSFKDHKDAENFIESGTFINIIKKQDDSTVRIILLVSLIEKNISSGYSPIENWVKTIDPAIDSIIESVIAELQGRSTEEIVKKAVIDLVNSHKEKFGLASHFADFVRDYVFSDDQKTLILSFNVRQNDVPMRYSRKFEHKLKVQTINDLKQKYEFKDAHIPKCYEWENCYIEEFGCRPEFGCVIDNDNTKFKDALKKVAKLIYTMRSEAVHTAGDKTLLKSGNGKVFSTLIIDGKSAVVTIAINDLERIFFKALKNYFDAKK